MVFQLALLLVSFHVSVMVLWICLSHHLMTPYFTPDKQSVDPMESRPSDMTSTSLMPTESDPLGKKGDKKTLTPFWLSGLLQRLFFFLLLCKEVGLGQGM